MSRAPERRATLLRLAACLAAAPALVALGLAVGPDPRQAEAARPLHAREADYAGASACRACHPDHFASWRRTYHATMTQLPSAASVLGRFDGREVALYGAAATPFERDGRFFMRLPAYGGDGPREAEVALCVGSRRYQQYFERTDDHDGITYRRLPLLWHVGEARWMHLNGVFLEADSDDWALHKSVWNANCLFCHNTGVVPGLRDVPGEAGRKRVDSHVGDLGIACEACHGPARDHVQHNGSLIARYGARLDGAARGGGAPGAGSGARGGGVVDPPRLPQAESAALCGQCHAQRLPDPLDKIWTFLDTGPTFRPGGVLAGHVRPIDRDTPSADPRAPDAFRKRFWADGTPRLTAYEYQGLTQSPCWKGGHFTCTSCHSMHGGDPAGQLTAEMRGDRACTQCHEAVARDVGAHTHHAPASSGSRCLDCHMPRVVYGVLDVHRSHRVESPDPARDAAAGRPDACTTCHLDRDAAWAADRRRALWGAKGTAGGAGEAARGSGEPAPPPPPPGDGVAAGLLALHAGDPVERAVAAAALGRDEAAVPPAARAFLLGNALVAMGDRYGAVRTLARRSALALDERLGAGLAGALRDFDVQAARGERERRLIELVNRFQAGAPARAGAAPAAARLLTPDGQLDVPKVQALLARQSNELVSIGE